MAKKYLYALLICLTILAVIFPRILKSNEPICSYHSEVYQGLELQALSEELGNTGLIGRIHGAARASNMFVMSVREPNNFFSHREFSLLARDRESLKILEQVNRHDLLCVQGNFIANPSPQQHIAISSIQVLNSWAQPEGFAPYQRQLIAELTQQGSLMVEVHAIAAKGAVLVVEYQDLILPIYVTATEYTQDLYRGDIVKLAYQIQGKPQNPTHLKLDTQAEKPLEVIDAISSWQNQEQTLTGNLVKFPQSPQLKFDVYAMAVDTKGIERFFTLVNFKDIEAFQQIRDKLANIWDANLATAVSGRNMLINPEVTIQAQGLINIVSPEQANPQILLDSAEDVVRF
ncbi:hypothetical protein Xen7305DRAFT_00017790 [Xenococcus sp. PCC 7305]|uniref:hypothetical protein n=1 Tax=Xenococcus sp. PCC 7305 TaxID=102125 RepID=UPI0002AC4557|nr:hypothetical protein [Xenococcus sp. PCC 7305]ELS02068.1 hypothetical protein Xen7305DRAFT_00017790 [Xenococcus sp. PCC 7305]